MFRREIDHLSDTIPYVRLEEKCPFVYTIPYVRLEEKCPFVYTIPYVRLEEK